MRTTLPRLRLQRAHAVERVLIEQIDVLETMTPQDFLAFRASLAPASGFQSVQFREIEFLSGAKDPAYLDRLHDASPAERDRLQRRLAEPTLWDGLLALLAKAGFDVATEESRREALLAVSRDRMRVRAALGPGRGAGRARLDVGAVAVPARADGRAADRDEVRHRRLDRRAVPAGADRRSLLPRTVGSSLGALNRTGSIRT